MTERTCRRASSSHIPHSTFHIRAFTLVELMIAVGLMLLLMIGINLIFRMTGQAVSAGQALSESQRNAQAVQSQLYRDMSNMVVEDAPVILLRSRTQAAFRNRQDMLSDRDYNPADTNVQNRRAQISSTDLDGDNVEGESTVVGEITTGAAINARSHRLDVFAFFARDQFQRQTGGGLLNNAPYQPLVADMTSNEAWIWYGHLHLPDNNGSFTNNTLPGAGTIGVNQNNFFATQWILGRVAILLREPEGAGAGTFGTITTRQSNDKVFHSFAYRDPLVTLPNHTVNAFNPRELGPLSHTSAFSPGAGVGTTLIGSRIDLAGTSIDGFKSIIQNLINAPGVGTFPWWGHLPFYLPSTTLTNGDPIPFRANPFVVKPINADTYSQQMPILLPACTQFIVEFAGDFIEQDNDPTSATFGQITNAYFDLPWPGGNVAVPPKTDGVVDYVVDWNDNGNETIDNAERASIKQRIRWYGLPRDTDGDGTIRGALNSAIRTNLLKDVVPLRDVVRSAGASPGMNGTLRGLLQANPVAPFEKFAASNQSPSLRLLDKYLDMTNPTNNAANMQTGEFYPCVWTYKDRKPSMFRITIVIDDPNGRLTDGQTFEYVFKVQ